MPRLHADVVKGEEFWSRASLQRNTEGPNFRNLPVFAFGIVQEGDQAFLFVPSLKYLNQVVDQHNQGGFHLAPAFGHVDSDAFLEMITKKNFPRGSDTSTMFGFVDPFLMYLRSERLPGAFYNTSPRLPIEEREATIVTNYYEHDMADHIGLLAAPRAEVNKLQTVGEAVQKHGASIDKSSFVVTLDALLGFLSSYAITNDTSTPQAAREPRANGSLPLTYQQFLEKQMVQKQQEINIWLKRINRAPLDLDFSAIRANIKRMHSLPSPLAELDSLTVA